MRSSIGAIALLGLLSSVAPAQPAQPAQRPAGRYVVRQLDRDDGLPDPNVAALARTRDGFLWIGTRTGLVSYDGVQFVPLAAEDAAQLPDAWINGLSLDPQDRLWIATAGGLAVREDGRVRRVAASEIPPSDVWRAITDRRGSVWVATSTGVFRGDGTAFRKFPGLDGYAYTLLEDARGRIWVVGRDLLTVIDGDRVIDVRAALGLSGRVFDIAADGPAHLWIGMEDGARHLSLGAGDDVRVDRFVDTRRGATTREVWVVALGEDGALLLGTSSGGVLTATADGLEPLESQDHETWALLRDGFGVIWAGTDQGLRRFEPSSFTLLSAGLSGGDVWTVRRDGAGTIWAGLGDGGVARWTGTRFVPVLRGDPSSSLSPATWPEGDHLLAVQPSGPLLRLAREGPPVAVPWRPPPIGDVLGLLADRRGRLWISADSGLYVRAPDGTVRAADTTVGLPRGARPRAMAEGPDGALWFGRPWLTAVGERGIRRITARDGLADSIVRVIVPQRDVTWIGTQSSGVFAVLPDRVVPLGHLHRALANEVLAIVEDAFSDLWVVSRFEVARVERAALLDAARGRRTEVMIRTYDVADGLPRTPFRGDFQSHVVADDRGRLLVPNGSGVVVIDPARLRREADAPPVQITSLSVNGRATRPAAGLELSPGVARLEFALAAPLSIRPRRVRLQARLVGADSVWRELGSHRDISFGPLHGGDYVFEARAATAEGDWPAPSVTLPLRVSRSLVEQPWFVPLLLALTAGIVFAIGLGRRRLLAREMEKRRTLEVALGRAQKLEGLGRLAGGVAHEINNSMAVVLGFTELALTDLRDRPAVREDLLEAQRAGVRVVSVTRRLLTFARQSNAERRILDLGATVAAMRRSLEELAGSRSTVRLEVDVDRTPISADAAQVEQLVLNLVANARDAMPVGGTITIGVRPSGAARPPQDALVTSAPPPQVAGWAVLSVRDVGVGMLREVRERLFEPFFTTKAVDKGTGLGLAVCHGIVVAHGGAIDVETAPGEGSCFSIWWPMVRREAPTPDAGAAPSPDQPGVRARILLVDDDESVRIATRRLLQSFGHEVLEAPDGATALARLNGDARDVDLVVTDVVMASMTGPELVAAMRDRHDGRPVLFITGFVDEGDLRGPPPSDLGPVLPKPFTAQELQGAVRAILRPEVRSVA